MTGRGETKASAGAILRRSYRGARRKLDAGEFTEDGRIVNDHDDVLWRAAPGHPGKLEGRQ
jgi:hypothetical protein